MPGTLQSWPMPFARSYREYNIQEKNKKTFETKAFIEEQLRLTSNRLKLAENELQAFKESYGLISLDAQTQNTLNRLYAVEVEYEKTKTDAAEVKSQLKMIQGKQIAKSGQLKESFFAAAPNSPVFGLKTKLSELLLKRRTLLINFTEKHPRVKEIDDQVQAVLHETGKELQSLLNSYRTREKNLSRRITQLRRENLSLPEKGSAAGQAAARRGAAGIPLFPVKGEIPGNVDPGIRQSGGGDDPETGRNPRTAVQHPIQGHDSCDRHRNGTHYRDRICVSSRSV